MKVLEFVEKFIFESSVKNFILVVFAILLLKTGIWYMPNLDVSLMVARAPFVNPLPTAHGGDYLYWSWFSPFLAKLLGIKNFRSFFLFHLFFSISFSLLFIKIVFSRFSDQIARTALILFIILPVSGIVYFWVGLDSVTLFIMLLALAFPRRLIVTILLGIALGMQHFEQGFFAVGALLLATILNPKFDTKSVYSLKFCIYFLVSIILGKLILLGVFRHHHIKVSFGRLEYVKEDFLGLVRGFYYQFQYILWATLGLGWLIALKYLEQGRRVMPFFISLLVLFLILIISGDRTRVFGIISFPLILTYWLLNENFLKQVTKKEIVVIFLLWTIMPWQYFWGMPEGSVLPYDVTWFLHKAFGWFSISKNMDIWPFNL